MEIFFSVGEPSGDLHGANLIAALRRRMPHCQFVGYGGPRMAAAGARLHADLTQLAVMWVLSAVLNLHKFVRLLRAADRYFREHRPDAVVLIDYPGFNWWIARRAKAQGIPVIYYGTPQLWAWASHRVRKMRKYVDHVLCKLPFEEKWFNDRGCHATYVGHPYFDELRNRSVDAAFVNELTGSGGRLVTILPGSRDQEVAGNARDLLLAAHRIAGRVSRVRFAVAAFKPEQAQVVAQLADELDVPVEVFTGRTPELIAAADVCLACSGSVSLELLYHGRPSVILYRVSRFGYEVQRWFRRVRYITLVNLLTTDDPSTTRPASVYDPYDPRDSHVLMPEYLTYQDRTRDVADHAIRWLTDATERQRIEHGLTDLADRVGQGGASELAADYIANLLDQHGTTVATIAA
ncbi:MAG: lipid-A-disaccharide synthase [Planctomycetales bacterium]|nr:lipid-A-disaccharide synthase [Planctomycetales bacterium]